MKRCKVFSIIVCVSSVRHISLLRLSKEWSSFVMRVGWTGISGILSDRVTQFSVKTALVSSVSVLAQKYYIAILSCGSVNVSIDWPVMFIFSIGGLQLRGDSRVVDR